MSDHHNVIIIGAGASGIAAGTWLLQNNFTDFIILEAENRYGGRIHSITLGEYPIDLGAQWIHGQMGNVVFEVANKLHLVDEKQFSDLETGDSFYLLGGQKLNEDECQVLVDLLNEIYEGNVGGDGGVMNGESLGGHVIKEFWYQLSTKKYDYINKTTASLVLEWFSKNINSEEGADDWREESYKGYLEYEELPGDQDVNWKNGTFAVFLNVLASNAKTPGQSTLDKILLNQTVKNINWEFPKGPSDLSRIKITCANKTYTCDYVIVTVSLGVLKGAQKLFTPTLPQSKLNAIENLQMGCVNKLIFLFPNQWWPKNSSGFNFVHENTEELLDYFKGDGTREENAWLIDINGAYTIDYKPKLLFVWLFGESARRMEAIPERDVQRKVLKLMRLFLKEFVIPEPEDFVRTKWGTNPNFLGSYSWQSLRSEQKMASPWQLAEPVVDANGVPRVLFAGEATHTSHYQTVHGAVESGYREAQRVLELVNPEES